jgi:hypothetical protein
MARFTTVDGSRRAGNLRVAVRRAVQALRRVTGEAGVVADVRARRLVGVPGFLRRRLHARVGTKGDRHARRDDRRCTNCQYESENSDHARLLLDNVLQTRKAGGSIAEMARKSRPTERRRRRPGPHASRHHHAPGLAPAWRAQRCDRQSFEQTGSRRYDGRRPVAWVLAATPAGDVLGAHHCESRVPRETGAPVPHCLEVLHACTAHPGWPGPLLRTAVRSARACAAAPGAPARDTHRGLRRRLRREGRAPPNGRVPWRAARRPTPASWSRTRSASRVRSRSG